MKLFQVSKKYYTGIINKLEAIKIIENVRVGMKSMLYITWTDTWL